MNGGSKATDISVHYDIIAVRMHHTEMREPQEKGTLLSCAHCVAVGHNLQLTWHFKSEELVDCFSI